MKKKFTLLIAAIALMAFLVPNKGWGQTRTEVTDVMNQTWTGVSGSSYTQVTGLEGSASDAVYTVQCAGGNSSIQLRSNNNNSGIVSTTSGGTVAKVTVTWNSNTSNGRTLNVYGSNSAYSAPSDLYGTNAGTLIGTIVCGTSTELTITDSYAYVGMRSASAAMYLDEIQVTWSTGGSSGPVTYTVTYDANGGTGTMTDPNSPYEEDDEVILLTNTFTAPEGKIWDSWEVKDANDQIITVTGGKFTMPANNVTVKAQWVDDPAAPQINWVLTDLADLTATDVFVIVGTRTDATYGGNYAMSNDKGTSNPPTAVAVTIASDKITSTVSSDIQWNIDGNATDGYTFYPNGSTTTWLYCTDGNNGVRVGTNTNKTFVLASGYLKHSGTSRYVGIYQSQDWRCYTDYNATNIKDQTFAFYKKVTGGVTPPSISADNVSIAYDATNGHINYTINNEPTPAGTLTASIFDGGTIANLALGTIASGAVSFTCDANPTGTARTATVTLTYTYNTDQTVTKNVTITQAGDPNIADNISDITGAGDYHVKGMVVATNSRGFIIGDGTGYVYTYLNAAPTWNVGDNLSITGTTSTSYGHVIQFTSAANVETTSSTNYNGDPQPLAITEVPDYSTGNHLSTYLQFEGTLTKETSGSYTNYNIAVGGSTIRVSYPTDDQITALDALLTKTVRVHGFFAGISGTTFTALMESVEEVVVPTLAVTPETVSVPYTGGSGNFTVTPSNVSSAFGGYVTFYDPANPENELDPEPTWIFISHDYSDFSLSYSITDVNNTTEPRTACFKFVVMCNEGLAKSNLITVTQAANIPTFDVTFDVDGGTFVANTDFPTVNEQKEAGTYHLPSATKAGSEFAGWSDGTTTYQANDEYTVSDDVDFTAQWNVITTGTIVFGNNGTKINAASVTGDDSMGHTWTITTEGTTSFTQSTEYSQIGSNSNPASKITFSMTLSEEVTFTSVSAKFVGSSGSSHASIQLKIGDDAVAYGEYTGANQAIVSSPNIAAGTSLTITILGITGGVRCFYINYTIDATTDPIIEAPSVVDLSSLATSGEIGYSIFRPVSGNNLTATTTTEWISGINVTADKVTFNVTQNTSTTDDRTGTITLSYPGATDKVVTVNQSKVDYATLPFTFTGGKSDIESTIGLTQSGLGSGYSGTANLQFDSEGDWLVLHLNEAPTSLSYDIKGNSFTDGVFTVVASADGIDYSYTLMFFTNTNLGNSLQTITHVDLASDVRYIKWIFNDKNSGNVGVGNIRATGNYDIYGKCTVASLAIGSKTCTVYSGGLLDATTISGASVDKLIIQDGGQVKCNNSFSGTMKKNIIGYGPGNEDGRANYYLMGAPVQIPVGAMLVPGGDSNFDKSDVYWFDGRYEKAEWRWAEVGGPTLVGINHHGFLFAYRDDCELSIWSGTGPFPATNATIDATDLTNIDSKAFGKWNLIGNPFTCNAYLAGNRPFYRMNAAGDAIVLASNSNGGNVIKPLEGVFILFGDTETATSVTFQTTDPTETSAGNNSSTLEISVSQAQGTRGEAVAIDAVRICFGEGQSLAKFNFMGNNNGLCIPQNGKDYAVVRSEAQGEMPVNFKAANDGTYTLDFSMDNVEFDYLHLIDNKTGMDIDLLQTPSYTFEATTHDYAARFRLVFSANSVNENSSESFAFISNGQLILTNVDNNTTVQMIDALGRMIVSTNAMNHVSTDNMAPGVYVLRLINGNDVKTQKIVVK